jgi:hypothetical protein
VLVSLFLHCLKGFEERLFGRVEEVHVEAERCVS